MHILVSLYLSRRSMNKNEKKAKDKKDFFPFLPNRLRTFSKPSSEMGPLGVSDAIHAL